LSYALITVYHRFRCVFYEIVANTILYIFHFGWNDDRVEEKTFGETMLRQEIIQLFSMHIEKGRRRNTSIKSLECTRRKMLEKHLTC